jgi:enoyl-CoA hydratase/carnithine racemase
MPDPILLSREGDIATVTLNRPDRLNAFNMAMWHRLTEVMAEVNADDGLRCVVLRGAGGKAFGAGADIAEFPEVRASAEGAAAYAHVLDCRHPTLAFIEGACVGGGLELAVLCDLRLCNASARFGIPINRIGHCLPYAGMIALVELAGRSTALEILLEGRVMGAEEAYDKGLVNRIFPDAEAEAEAAATARRIARGAPLAARWHKVFARRALRPESLTEAEWAEPFRTCDTEDYHEGIRAFLAKEKPVFKGK